MKRFRSIYCFIILGYILGIHKGQVALWSDSNAEPIKIFPYSAASLPEADQQLLEKGIPINNSRELTSLLEDYFS